VHSLAAPAVAEAEKATPPDSKRAEGAPKKAEKKEVKDWKKIERTRRSSELQSRVEHAGGHTVRCHLSERHRLMREEP